MPFKNDDDWKIFSRWTIRRISFIGILIAIAVVFLIIGATLMPLVTIPSYKISFIGLPIKISGFIFGPIIGGLVGLISDILSFMFIPSFYNPLFTLAAVVDGVVSGLIGWLFLKLFKYYFGGSFRDSVYESQIYTVFKKLTKLKNNNASQNKITNLENKIIYLYEKRKSIRVDRSNRRILLNINMITSALLIAVLSLLVVWIIGWKVEQHIIDGGFIKSRLLLIIFMLSGYSSMLLFILIARIKMKPKNYLVIIPIIIFSAVIEFINVPLLAYADMKSYGGTNSLFVYVFQHTLFSPVKIWFNMFIIFFTYNIISPLIHKNNDICY